MYGWMQYSAWIAVPREDVTDCNSAELCFFYPVKLILPEIEQLEGVSDADAGKL